MVIASSDGWVRFVDDGDDVFEAMYRIGCASITAEETARPAFREIIDTLRWEHIR